MCSYRVRVRAVSRRKAVQGVALAFGARASTSKNGEEWLCGMAQYYE